MFGISLEILKLLYYIDPAKTANPTCGPVPQDAVVATTVANTTTDLPLDPWASTEGLEGVHHLVVWASREVVAEVIFKFVSCSN